MISHAEAQELHELVGAALVAVENGQTAVVAELERARELAAIIVSDTDPEKDEVICGFLTDRETPRIGIVAEVREGVAPSGEDLWVILDEFGDTHERAAGWCPVIDDERIDELKRALATYRKEQG